MKMYGGVQMIKDDFHIHKNLPVCHTRSFWFTGTTSFI